MLFAFMFVTLSVILLCGKDLQICMHMKSADIFSSQGDNMVYMMDNTSMLGKIVSLPVKFLNLIHLNPRGGCSFYRCLPKTSTHRNLCFILSIVFFLIYFFLFRIMMISVPFSEGLSIFSSIFSKIFLTRLFTFFCIGSPSLFVGWGIFIFLMLYFICLRPAFYAVTASITPRNMPSLAGGSSKDRFIYSSTFSFEHIRMIFHKFIFINGEIQ